jgi:phosphate transport system substrate-binding protein
MVPMAIDLLETFAEDKQSVTFEVSGGGTSFGLNALESGEADLALVSWLPADLHNRWRATVIARDGLAVIVHPCNSVSGLGLLQLRDLFSGRILEWEAVPRSGSKGQVVPISREEGSGTRAAFEVMVMEELSVTPRALVAPSDSAVVDYVSDHPLAIGYAAMSQVDPGVKVIRVEGELPKRQTAGPASYPLTRELGLVTRHPPANRLQEFVSFVLGPAGQRIVEKRFGPVR